MEGRVQSPVAEACSWELGSSSTWWKGHLEAHIDIAQEAVEDEGVSGFGA